MPKIQLNERGTRFLDVTEENLQTIEKFNLFESLTDSHGYITEETLERLRLTVRSLIASSTFNTQALLNLCIDVIYAPHFKAFGLANLVALYRERIAAKDADQHPEFF